MNINNEKLEDVVSISRWIIIPMIIVGYLLCFMIGQHTNELKLINKHKNSRGIILDAKEDADKGDDGILRFYWDVKYEFHTDNGQKLFNIQSGSGRLPDNLFTDSEIEVEYYPKLPSINRIRGMGNNSIDQWLEATWFYWILSMIYFLLFVFGLRYLYFIWQKHSFIHFINKVFLVSLIPILFIISENSSFFGLDNRIWLIGIPVAIILYLVFNKKDSIENNS